MSQTSFSYYQFKKDLGYQVYLRFEDLDFETQMAQVLTIMGFDKVERDDVKNINFDPTKTKVLKVTEASHAVSK